MGAIIIAALLYGSIYLLYRYLIKPLVVDSNWLMLTTKRWRGTKISRFGKLLWIPIALLIPLALGFIEVLENLLSDYWL